MSYNTVSIKSVLSAAIGIGSAIAVLAENPAAKELPPILGAEQYGSRVLLLDTNREDWDHPEAVLWNWHPVFDTDGLLPTCIPWFGGITDAKPVMNMTHVLITGSCGAVSLVRMKDKKTLFCVYSRGSHSAELLPDGNVVSAAAGPNGCLELFDISTYDPMHPEAVNRVSYPCPHIHGTVWDYEQNCLWVNCAVGISRWEYKAKPTPSLKMTHQYPVEKERFYWGHDLYPIPGSKKLFATGRNVQIFDTQTRKYELHSDVVCKSISQASPDGPVIVAIPREEWWTDTAMLLKDGKQTPFRTRKNMRFYKFRWFIHNDFSYGPLQLEKPADQQQGSSSAAEKK